MNYFSGGLIVFSIVLAISVVGLQDLFFVLKIGLTTGLMPLFGFALMGLIGGFKVSKIEVTAAPNQRIWNSARNYIFLIFVGWSFLSLFLLLITFLTNTTNTSISILNIFMLLSILLYFSIYFGLFVGMMIGGTTLVQHFALRTILYHKGRIPWNYARFLDYAAERLFLQKVGGGYIFIHRLLMEHFAQLELENQK